jgi:outer membrane protein assembly factor BamB
VSRRRPRPLAIFVAVLVAGGAAAVGAAVETSRAAAPGRSNRTSARPGARRPTRVRVAWARLTHGPPSQLAADDHGVIVTGSGGVVTALAAGDAAEQWDVRIDRDPTPFYEPAADATTVLVSATDRFVALDRATGLRRWEVPADEALAVALAPTIDGSVVAVTATFAGGLVGRDTRDGRPRWSIAPEGVLDAHLAVVARAGAVASVWRTDDGATVQLLDAATGTTRWRKRVDAFASSPAAVDDVLVVADGDGDYHARVRALGVADGTTRWSTSVPASFESDLVPAVDPVAGEIAVIDHLGTLSLLDLRTGALRRRIVTDVPVLGGRPVLTSRLVAVRNEGQELVLVDRRTGTVIDRRTDPDSLPEAIVGAGGRVLVAWRGSDRVEALDPTPRGR